MHDSAQVRKTIKRQCKRRVKEQIGRCVGIQFLYAVPYFLLVLMLYLTIFGDLFALYANGYRGDALGMAVGRNLNAVWLVIFVMLVVTGPLLYGMMRFYIGLSRGEEPGVSALFQPFTSLRSFWAGVRMEFCLFFRQLLWSVLPTMLFFFAGMGLLASAAVSGHYLTRADVTGAAAMLYVLYQLVLLPIRIKMMTYQAGWVLVSEQEARGAWDATRDGSSVFHGQYGKVFRFVLSFFWWYVLSGLVSGLCWLIALFGFVFIPGAPGFAVFLLALTAGACLGVVINGFLAAYINTSFVCLFEFYAGRTQNGGAPEQ